MSSFQAIETTYNDRRFRSRLEARWAVVFDRTWFRWDYETEGIQLPAGPYLPDFRLYRDDGSAMWVEIKPAHEIPEPTFTKLAELASESGETCFLLSGPPKPGEFEWWQFLPGGVRVHVRNTRRPPYLPEDMLEATDVPWENVRDAMRAGMAARFEHGETPDHDGLTNIGKVMGELMRGRIGREVRKGEMVERVRHNVPPAGEVSA